MRIFVGVDLDSEIRARIERFVEGVRGFAPEARWARPESLHITLKFIGEQTAAHVEAIVTRLRRVKAGAFEIRCAGYGFFPTAKAPRVFWIGIQAGPALGALAATIDDAVAELGIAREDRPYSPHLTLARGGGGSGAPKWRAGDSPNKAFTVLEKRLGAMGELDFGTMSAREFILYQSQLSPAGSKYTRLQRFPLRLNC
ncbi:MAG TPA: RNA 2',3'-cyclic phosphodiesterase [Terriglobales bacterium]|nr:RNA 2',3'-cyclic phosphodiesterase [Terriglobales bacterium]